MSTKIKPKKIGELVEVFNNLRVPLSSKEREKIEKIYPYYGAQNIVDYVDNYLFDGEYILAAEDGENLRSNNQNICNLVNGKFWVNNHAHILCANKENNTKYLYYNFNRINFEPYITGSAQPKLNKENLLNIVTNVHEIEEQLKIVSVLTSLDSKIELNNKINIELEAMAKTIYDYWFVQFEFPNAKGKPYKNSGGKMVWNDELKREIPEEWEVKPLGKAINIIRGASPRPIDDFLSDEGMPWVKISDATKSNSRFIIETKQFIIQDGISKSRPVFPNTLILSNSASPAIPRIMKIDACVHDGWLVIDKYSGGLTPEFMFHYFDYERPRILSLGSGSIFKNLKTDYLKDYKFIVPSKSILDQLSPQFKTINETIYTKTIENQQLASFRDWLLPMLMNGQVKVGDAEKMVEEKLSMAAEPSEVYKKSKK